MDNSVNWEPLLRSDLASVKEIADSVHTGFQERAEVFAEKLELFPAGCLKLVSRNRLVGYGISHPWALNSIPPLDEFLGSIPAGPPCIYIHDVAVLLEARGRGAAEGYVVCIKKLAAEMHIPTLALVAVYGADILWARFGFRTVQTGRLKNKMSSYGPTARYMIC